MRFSPRSNSVTIPSIGASQSSWVRLPDQRGVVCAASYEARKFKVRSAMPSRTAGKLCPHGIFVRPRMDAYRAESAAIMEILPNVTPIIEKVSVDEAYLDVSASFDAPPKSMTMP